MFQATKLETLYPDERYDFHGVILWSAINNIIYALPAFPMDVDCRHRALHDFHL